MNRSATITLLASFLMGASAYAQDADATAKAQDAAQAWLSVVDAGRYADSWERSAAFFQAVITKPAWIAAVQPVRAPLGNVKSRTLKSAAPTHTLPGAPDGDYVVIQYSSQFAHKASATETVTPMKQADGSWKVSGYFIQ